MKKQILILLINLFITPIIAYSQNEAFPDFVDKRPTLSDSMRKIALFKQKIRDSLEEIAHLEQRRINECIYIERMKDIKLMPKFNLKDTAFHTFLKNDFSFKADSFFEFSMTYKAYNQDSILLSVSFKNTSPNGMYVHLASVKDSFIEKILRFSPVDIIFYMDCHATFIMKKINSQAILNKTFYINRLDFESVFYELYIVNDMAKLTNSSSDPTSFIRGILEDRLLIGGMGEGDIFDYQGLTRVYITNYPINDKVGKVNFLMQNN